MKRSLLLATCLSTCGLAGGLPGCAGSGKPAAIEPVDKDIDGQVIVQTEAEDEVDGGAPATASLFGGDDSASGGSGGGGGLFGDDGDGATSGASSGGRRFSGGSKGGDLLDDGSEEESGEAGSGGLFGDSDAVAPSEEAPARLDRMRSSRREIGGESSDGADGPAIISDLEPSDAEDETTRPDFDPALSPGRLTAGAISDLPDTGPYREFVAGLAGDEDNVFASMLGQTFALQFNTEDGKPLSNAMVTVADQAGDRTITLRTRTDGRAVVSTRWDLLESEEDLLVTVNPERGRDYTVTVDPGNPVTHTVPVPGARDSRSIETIQIALVLDCTGSMGDELEYLKVELKSIAEAVAEAYPDVEQQFALVAYRDADDAYTTRTIDFTTSIDEFIVALGGQNADGGGDTPEAVHRAFAEAAGLSWDDRRAARIALHVADAPPHGDQQAPSLRHIDTLRSLGVAVYPVASSSADAYAQFTMRTSALLTGAQYLFLTDDSGVGNAHAEPTESTGYAVMPLRSHLLRVIASEIAGEPIAIDAGKIIREVDE